MCTEISSNYVYILFGCLLQIWNLGELQSRLRRHCETFRKVSFVRFLGTSGRRWCNPGIARFFGALAMTKQLQLQTYIAASRAKGVA